MDVQWLCNSYTMACPPVRGDNPRALALVQVDKHALTILYHLAYDEIFRAKVGKCGIKLTSSYPLKLNWTTKPIGIKLDG